MRPLHLSIALVILLIAGFLLFWKLGANSFHNEDEATNAHCAREMVRDGDYMSVHYRGELYVVKPSTKIWLVALGQKLFGVNELGTRFSSALFALGTIALTIVLGVSLFGPAQGLLSGVILLSSVQFIHEHCGRTAEHEPETVFFYVLSMLCLWKVSESRRWFYGLALSLGLLLMVKGPVVGPALITALLYLIIDRKRAAISRGSAAAAIAIFLATVVPWHVHQWVVLGRDFIHMYFSAHILGRFTGSPPADQAPFVGGIGESLRLGLYPKSVFYSMFPWSILVIPALFFVVRRAIRRSSAGLLLALWIAVFAVVIFASNGKLPAYMIPILPALAISVSHVLHRALEAKPSAALSAFLLAALVLSVLFVPAPDYDPYPRVSFKWPHEDPNLIPVWRAGAETTEVLTPVVVTVILALATAIYALVRRFRAGLPGEKRRLVWILVLTSFVFSGLYHVIRPLKGAEHTGETTRYLEAVREADIRPGRLILLGKEANKRWQSRVGYFYLFDLAGGWDPDTTIRPTLTPAVLDSAAASRGALILADRPLRKQISSFPRAVSLLQGKEVDLYYVGSP